MPLLANQLQSQLLVIDQQTRLADAMPEHEWQQVKTNSERLLEAASALEIPVIISEQYPKGLGHTADDIKQKVSENSHYFEKTLFSCCQNTDYKNQLIKNNRKQLIVCGMETHVCVLQTAFDAMESGFEVFVVADAVCSRNPEHKHNALMRLQQAGIIISNHESVLFEWLRDAKHEKFKFISSLLK